MSVDPTLIVQIITFIGFLWLLYRLFGQTIATVLRKRADAITNGLRAAEENQQREQELQREAQQQLDQARAEAQSIVASAKRAAESQRQALIAQADNDARALVQRARTEIERERQAALDELRREAARLAILAAGRVISASLDERKSRDLADRAIADVGGAR